MSNSTVFAFFNEYPVLPVTVIVATSLGFIPIIFILYIAQVAPLHSNCRCILCIWVLGFGSSFIVNYGLVILDLENETGYMPLSAFEPQSRYPLYQWYSMTGIFSSFCELLLSVERILSIIRPRQYHFSRFAWKTLLCITLSMMALSYFVDYFVHNVDGFMRLVGCIILNAIEVAVLSTGIMAIRICRNSYQKMDGDCNLTTKEAYEMSRAMIPAYIASFLVKALNIIVLFAYFAINDMSLTGYAQDYLLMTAVGNGTFSMINLLVKHPLLRKYSTRKLRLLLRLNAKAENTKRTSIAADADAYFSMYSASWK